MTRLEIKQQEKEAEEFVDDYIKRFYCSPSYVTIQKHFKMDNPSTARNRCRGFRDKMKIEFTL